jgi:osmotically-inducible protein OsmY
MPNEDAMMTRMVEREITRRMIDASRLSVKVLHGVVYLNGEIRGLRGYNTDLKEELDIIYKILRQRPGIRDVVIDVTTHQ